MRERLRLVLAAVLAVGVLAVVLVVRPGGSGDAAPPAGTGDGTSTDASAIDVRILVPDTADADKRVEMITQAIGMWQRGLVAAASDPTVGAPADVSFNVTSDRVGAGAPFSLTDPEIVIIAADQAPGGHAEPMRTALDISGSDGAGCDQVGDAFSYAAWSGRTGFDSHHGKPEGVYLDHCGADGADKVCVAVNSTIDPAASMSQAFDAFGLVADEFGHCLTLGGWQ